MISGHRNSKITGSSFIIRDTKGKNLRILEFIYEGSER